MGYEKDLFDDLCSFIHLPASNRFYQNLRIEIIELTPFSTLEELLSFFRQRKFQDNSKKSHIIDSLVMRYQEKQENMLYKILFLLLYSGISNNANKLTWKGMTKDTAWSDAMWGFSEALQRYKSTAAGKTIVNLIRNSYKYALKTRRENIPADEVTSDKKCFDQKIFEDFLHGRLEIEDEQPDFDSLLANLPLKIADISLIISTRFLQINLQKYAETQGWTYESARKKRIRSEKVLKAYLEASLAPEHHREFISLIIDRYTHFREHE